ncbi:MAG TPA: hypothetical protein VIJ53_11920, partial [Acidobacteriaceae bacterium]
QCGTNNRSQPDVGLTDWLKSRWLRLTHKFAYAPSRFAFLVRPDDASSLRKVLSINTCLWGGKFNPIIPFIKQVPKWWDRHGHRFESATEIVNGYLDFFEPDFVVETKAGMADGFGFDSERVLQTSDLLRREGNRHFDGIGLNVFELYSDLYLKEFQFARRHEHNIVEASSEDGRFSDMTACLLGAFPEEKELAYIENAFRDAFAPQKLSLNAAAFLELNRTGCTSALRLGHSKVDVDYHDSYLGPYLFITAVRLKYF